MEDNYNRENFIQTNSLDGGFLQSEEWRKFQESVGRKTFHLELKSPSNPPFEKGEVFGFWANVVEHQLPVVGKYFYIPRGPVIGISNDKFQITNQIQSPNDKIVKELEELINLAKKEKAGWVRIEPQSEELLNVIKNLVKLKIAKAPHDMQPKEIFVIDITKSEEDLLAGMKQKTRYNIRLAQKHKVFINVIPAKAGIQRDPLDSGSGTGVARYIDEFIRLVKITAKRDGITPHPESYYRKMFEIIPPENLKLYVAEYEGKVIAANIIIHYGDTATYLHGASDNEHRNVMAPYLLQWQAILDAKNAGYSKYDFGGVKTGDDSSWAGITKFKTGFSPNTEPKAFPGSYDIVINPFKYYLYRVLQKFKSVI